MKRLVKLLALVLCFAMALDASCFASGEASGGSSEESREVGPVAFTVTRNGVSRAEDIGGFALNAGSLGPKEADGIDLAVTDFATSGIQITDGAEYTIRNSVITAVPSAVAGVTDAGGFCAGVTDGVLTIENSTLTSSGKGGVFGNYVVYCAENGTLVVINSSIIQLGTAGDPEGYTDAVMEPPSNGGLLISGYSRANMSMGVTKTYYYGSYVETDGWAAMSTDMTRDLSFYAYDSVGKAIHGGYGTYADTSCKDYFYGSVLSGAELGAIISNNGEIHMAPGDAADDAALAYLPADYQVSAEYTARRGRSVIEGGRNSLQIHSPENSGGSVRGMIAVFTAEDTDIITSDELDKNAVLVDWAADYGPSVAEYIDFVKGANFLVKSACADITLTDCVAVSTSNTLLMTAVNSDSMSCYALPQHDMTGRGTVMTLADCHITGDVKAYDYQRNCAVALVNTTWEGAYDTWTKEQWNGVWSDECKADPLCCWVLDDSFHDGTGNGSSMTIDSSSRWVVSGESHISELTVAPGGFLNGIVTVNGVETDVTAGGQWEGDIVILPEPGYTPHVEGGPSGAPSGEAS